MKHAVTLTLLMALHLGAASYKTIQPGYSVQDRACIIPAPPHSVYIYFTPDFPLCRSGYHAHDYCDGGRPNIHTTPQKGLTDFSGCVNITVYAPQYAGSYSLTASSSYTLNVDGGHYTVKYTGAVLSNFNDAWLAYQRQSDSGHQNMQVYLTSREAGYVNAVGYTWKTAMQYYQPLFLTRGSIPWGGWLDNTTIYWAPSTIDAHGTGSSWDFVNNLDGAQQMVLLQILSDPAYGNSCSVFGLTGQTQLPLATAAVWHVTC